MQRACAGPLPEMNFTLRDIQKEGKIASLSQTACLVRVICKSLDQDLFKNIWKQFMDYIESFWH